MTAALISGMTTGCREDDFLSGQTAIGPDGEVVFEIDIESAEGTRSAVDESKKSFATGELVHIRAEYDCELNGNHYKEVQYGVLQYGGRGVWNAYGSDYSLKWPNEAVSGTFTAYYINGSNGVLSGNTGDARLISDYAFNEIPLHAEAVDVTYGRAVKLPMKRVFSLLTLTEIKEGISDEFWFTIPEDATNAEADGTETTQGADSDGKPREISLLNNAFRILFDPETYEMTQEFSRVESADYKDDNGNPLAYVKSRITYSANPDNPDEMVSEINFLLEPGAYHKFNMLYPRSRTSYATYLTYGRDLSKYTSTDGFVPNGRYKFSILKSLGVIVEETPEDGWDESEPTVIVDVEAFMKAVNSGADYYEQDLYSEEMVQILENTTEGTRLLRNVDFRYYQYNMFSDGVFPNLNSTFNGDYHYIYHMGCPLLYENNGTIINLGIREAETKEPIISSQNLSVYGQTIDTSYNGLIACKNNGTVSNVRVDKASITVQIQTTDFNGSSQEAHNASILFGSNRGNVYDIGVADELTLIVENAEGQTRMPSVSIGGAAGQNIGTIYSINPIDEEGFEAPVIKVYNKCNGTNGVYRTGGLVGNNTGNLHDIFITSLEVDASESDGLEQYLGGLAGHIPTSTSGAPKISGCIVRGEAIAGQITPVTNLFSCSYAGGVAGEMTMQAQLTDCSVSVGVSDTSQEAEESPDVEYAIGGAFGVLSIAQGVQEGEILTLACYGNKLSGYGAKGNFAGIVDGGFDWSHFENNTINVRQFTGENIGLTRNSANGIKRR